jgi:hypothetical protein
MARGTIPSVQEALQYSVNMRNNVEGVRQSLYDFQVYPTAGATQFTFFQTPQGQAGTSASGVVNTGAKNLGDTNMESAGQLPAPKMFLIESIEIIFEPGSVATAGTYTAQGPHAAPGAGAANVSLPTGAINDVDAIRRGGWLNLFIGSKSYLTEAPLGRFPPKTRMEIDASLAGTYASGTSESIATAKFGGRPYYVEPAILLPSTQNFNVTLNWGVAVATPSTFNGRLGVILDGYLYRNSQ